MTDKISNQGMLDTYLFECEQLLEQIQKILMEQKEKAFMEEEEIREIFRGIHTIKGISGMMLYEEIKRISHKLEDVLSYVRENVGQQVKRQEIHLELINHILMVTDFISTELVKIGNAEEADGKADGCMSKLEIFLEQLKVKNPVREKIIEEKIKEEPQQFYIPPKASGVNSFYKIHLTFKTGLAMANVHAYKIIHSLKEIAEDMIYEPEDIIADDNTADIILKKGFDILLQTSKKEEELRKILKTGYAITNVEIISGTAKEYCKGFEEEDKEERPYMPGDFVIESKEPGKGKRLVKDRMERTSYIRVEAKKMDSLVGLAEELLASQEMFFRHQDYMEADISSDSFKRAEKRMKSAASNLRNMIISMSKVSLNHTFQRMNRIVFEAAKQLEKEIDFEMNGEDLELEKSIVEHLLAPLMHLVRNSADHGIEMPDVRELKGKARKGRIVLTAKIEANEVQISVTDDGKGLSTEKILERARKQGLIDSDKKNHEYTAEEIYQMITLPGFSTKEEITEYSGRGVGMDVVISNLQEIGGRLEIESGEGKGCRMTMIIPSKTNR